MAAKGPGDSWEIIQKTKQEGVRQEEVVWSAQSHVQISGLLLVS